VAPPPPTEHPVIRTAFDIDCAIYVLRVCWWSVTN
jgi:hypothetical protein